MVSTPLEQVPGPYEDTTCQMVAAYGRSDHPHLEVIREFRDEVLRSNYLGRKFVDAYYSTAPLFTALVYKNRFLQKAALYGLAYPSYLISRTVLRS